MSDTDPRDLIAELKRLSNLGSFTDRDTSYSQRAMRAAAAALSTALEDQATAELAVIRWEAVAEALKRRVAARDAVIAATFAEARKRIRKTPTDGMIGLLDILDAAPESALACVIAEAKAEAVGVARGRLVNHGPVSARILTLLEVLAAEYRIEAGK